MGHFGRLQLIGKITYYAGWIALLWGGLLQLNMARTLAVTMNVTKRNLLEVSVMCFIICIASELRSREAIGKDKEMSSGLKKAA
jgi:hypothetical protein